MHNPLFYERQRMRASTWNIPRFLHNYDETLDGGLILPRGMLDTVTSLAAQAGSRLDITDERTEGTPQEFTFTATLAGVQQAAVTDLARYDLGVLVALPGAGKTVMACAVIAARQVSTLVLVDRRHSPTSGGPGSPSSSASRPGSSAAAGPSCAARSTSSPSRRCRAVTTSPR
jgi:hypothetical protein